MGKLPRVASEAMTSARVRIRQFTDPTCPFAFSGERQRLRLRWRYGDQLEWETRMVVLTETPDDRPAPELLVSSRRRLHGEHGMPMAWTPEPASALSVEGCRLVVAARRHDTAAADALLRRLRVLNFAGRAIDEPDVLARARDEAGLDAGVLAGWAAEPETETELRADMRAAREPSPAARALDFKLGGPDGARRYTCPSYALRALDGGVTIDLPGFWPVDTYVAGLANVAPELEVRPDPDAVEEVLAWAAMPLATAEVAAIWDRDVDEAREALGDVARFEPVGADGYWS